MSFIRPATKQHIKEFGADIDRHEIFLLAASIAYTTALALAPFVLILLSVASLLGPEMQQKLYQNMAETVGPQAGAAILNVVQNTKEHPSLSGLSSIIGFLILLFSASAIFYQLRVALDKINDNEIAKRQAGFKGFVKDRIFSIGLVFGFAFLSVVSLILSSTLAAVFPGGEGFLLKTFSFLVNFILFGTIFTLIYRFVPSQKMLWKTCFISGFVSTIFYLGGKTLISIYLGKASIGSAYGAAGSLVAFLAWVYYTALILLVSYEFSKVLVLKRIDKSHKTRPKKSRRAGLYAPV